MNGVELLKHELKRKFPTAKVDVTIDSDGLYVIEIYRDWGKFDKQAQYAVTYAALDKIPLELLAKVKHIETRS